MKKKPVSFDQLPPVIAQMLRRSVSRIQRILFMRGLFATAATGVAALLAIMAIDATVTIYDASVRWVMTLTGFAVTCASGWFFWWRPLSKPWTPSRIAAVIEQRHPELEERLSTVVELLSMPDAAARGSEQLMAVLQGAAEADARDVSPEREFTVRTVKPKLIAAGVGIGILAALALLWPVHTGRLLLRAVAPAAEVSNVYADNISVEPGDIVMLAGETLEINLTVRGGFPGQAYVLREMSATPAATNKSDDVEYTDAEAGEESADEGGLFSMFKRSPKREVSERMRQIEASSESAEPAESKEEEGEAEANVRVFRQVLPNVESGFRYRVSCGHALTRYYMVTVVNPPDASALSVTYKLPAYTGQAPITLTNGISEISAVPGTTVELHRSERKGKGVPSKLVQSVLLTEGNLAVDGNPADTNRTAWTFAIETNTSGRCALMLQDSFGFTNTPAFLSVRPAIDQPPTLTLLRPIELRVKLAPDARVNLEVEAADDFGLAPIEVLRALDSGEFEVESSVKLSEEGSGAQIKASGTLSLGQMDLGNARRVRVKVRVSDKRPDEFGGAQWAESPVIDIELDKEALSLERQLIEQQAKTVDEALKDLVEKLKTAEQEIKPLDDKLQKGEKLNEQDMQKLEQARKDAAEAEQQARDLTEQAKETAFDPIAKQVEKMQQEDITPAREKVEEAQLDSSAAKQKDAVHKAEENLKDAIAQAEQAIKDNQALAEKLDQLAQMEEMAANEQALADSAAQEMTPEELKAWQEAQEALMEQLKQDIAQDPTALQEALKNQTNALNNLMQEAKNLAQQQEQLKNDQTKSNEQKAQEQQALADKADELGQKAEQMAEDLKDFGEQQTADAMKDAAQQLDKAEEQGDKAAEQLQQNQDPKNAQEQAKEALDKAAGAMEKAQQQLGEKLEELAKQAEAAQQEQAEAMNEALDAMQQAADQAKPEGGDKQKQQQQAQKAADQLQQAAKQEAQEIGVPLPSAMPGMKPPKKAQSVPQNGIPEQFRAQMNDEDWFRIKGAAKSGSLEDALRRVPAEYRELVRQYFSELSRREN